jgi:hypothetical protein
LAANPYDLATGSLPLNPAAVLAIEKLDSRRLVRWLSQCKTPAEFVQTRPGPGASCPPDKPKCKKCPKFKDCWANLDYVDAGFVEQVITFYWPGRWGTRDVKVFQQDGQWHAEGYFWVEHSDGKKQELFVSGQCDVKKKRDGSPLSTGFDRKGALSDMIKKGSAMMLGIAFDIYNRRDPSIPDIGAAAEAQKSESKAKVGFRKLLGQIDDMFSLLHKDTPDVVPENYPASSLWADAVKMYEKLTPFLVDADLQDPKKVLDTILERLTEEESRALWGKLQAKYLNSKSEWRTTQRTAAKPAPPAEKTPPMPWIAGMEATPDERKNEVEAVLNELHDAFPSITASARETMLTQHIRLCTKRREWYECTTVELKKAVKQLKAAASEKGGR